ncbi:acyltransferase family protein [Actinomadura madurae]|uniref:acyltransferase family protein n=1 Tax=Actinomadura madurae TaxID=1993 RepID=UPI0020D1F6D4|nr:acyltransferase [Actinomadura madurae]MCQ0012140.1 acyltransferase [Actinomadura madurae]
MSWLDALRGLAAMVVVFEHSLDVLLPEVRRGASPWFDFGRYGVFVFFLVSGYVVPFSLERRGSVRHFWAGRVFRLYPAWFVSAALALALGSAGLSYGLPAALGERPWASTLAHLTMLQDLLGVPNIVNVYWTLSYEMVFYLLVTAMFVAGVHRSSARVALGFGVGAAILGVALPSGLLASRWPGGTILAAALCLAGGLAAMVSPAAHGAPRRGRGRGGAGPRPAGPRQPHRRHREPVRHRHHVRRDGDPRHPGRQAPGPAGRRDGRGRPLLSVAAGMRTPTSWALYANPNPLGRDWSIAVAAAWLTFLAGLALRNRPMPRFLVWLGLISYSVYLLHPLVVQGIWHAAGRDTWGLPVTVRAAWGVVLLATVLTSAGLVHRFVERPAQNLGRRVTSRRRDDSVRFLAYSEADLRQSS